MSESSVDLPEWAEPLFQPSRWKSLRGGRGGAKSWSVATALLIKGLQKRERILCAREFQNSIKDSVHRLLADRAHALGLQYEVTQTEIRAKNGTEFLFAGLRHNVNSIKSTEGVTIVWCEEAQCISDESWRILIPTIRADGSEIWATWNPDLDTDPTYKRLVTNKPPDCIEIVVNWNDNPWLSKELEAEKDYAYRVDPDTAAHVWGGQCRRNSQAAVLRGRWRVESFEPKPDWDGPYFGADWGFGVDPTALVKSWIHGRTLYIEREAYGVGVDLDDTPELFDAVPGAREHTIRADNSRPETISHMRRHGYTKILGCPKGAGSVEDGVEHLRSYEAIVIHPKCPHTAEEARLWSYKTDRLTGDVMPMLVDKHNHCWDATRYALWPIIRAGRPVKPEEAPKPKRHDYDSRDRGGDDWKTV